MTTAKEKEISHKKQRKWLIPGILLILLILLLLSAFLLIHRLSAFAVNELNAIFLVQTEPGLIVEDGKQVWDTETTIDLFRTEYDGIGRDITVQSSNGDKLIAPGTESEYTFTLKNTGNVAMDYSVTMDADLFVEGKEISLDNFPLGIRLRHYSGEYLLGDGDTWIEISKLNDYVADGTLAVNHYAWYTIEWKWLFEENVIDDHGELQLNVTDELDTMLGNITVESPIVLNVSILTSARPNDDAVARGGIVQILEEDGSVAGWFILLLILLLILITVTAIGFGFSLRDRKKERERRTRQSMSLTGD